MRLFSVSILVAFFSVTSAFSQVKFIYQDLDKAKQEARVEGRYIIVDVYADWCGWCKKMDANTFHDEGVSDFINSNMVALKLNSDKGVGREIAAKYGVTGLPTILYLDYKGELVEKKSGYKSPTQIMIDLEPYVLPKSNKSKSRDEKVTFDNYVDSKQAIFEELEDEVLKEEGSLSESYELGKEKKAFEFDEMKGRSTNSLSIVEIAKMDVFYFLGQDKIESAFNKVINDDLIDAFTLSETHFMVIAFMQKGMYKIEMLQMINEHSAGTKDIELLSTKASLQYKLGDGSDAKDTLAKAKKIIKKAKTETPKSLKILGDLI